MEEGEARRGLNEVYKKAGRADAHLADGSGSPDVGWHHRMLALDGSRAEGGH